MRGSVIKLAFRMNEKQIIMLLNNEKQNNKEELYEIIIYSFLLLNSKLGKEYGPNYSNEILYIAIVACDI